MTIEDVRVQLISYVVRSSLITPAYLNRVVEQEAAEDQRVKLLISSSVPYQSVASCSLMSFPTFFDSLQHQIGIYSSTTSTTLGDQALLYNQRADKVLWQGETSCDQVCTSESLLHHVVDVDKDEYHNMFSLYAAKINLERHERNINKPVKYGTSSKARLLQKMKSQQDHIPDQKIALDYKFQSSAHHDGHQHQESNIGETRDSSLTISNNNSSRSSTSTVCSVRVCSDCSTNTTPLWRSGPRGPKSLCNACGIRQRKARRAMAEAAAAAANGFVVGTTNTTTATTAASSSMNKGKEKKWRGNGHNVSVRRKNKRKLIMTDVSASTASYKYYKRNNKQLCDFEQLAAFPPSVLFAQDVAEAAFLLMELSCGLVA